MNLWIRSQNKKTLSIIKHIQYVEFDGEYSLVGYADDYADDFDLGIYKTKERALEVLDDIQNILMPKTIIESEKSMPKTNFKVEIVDPKDYGIEILNTYVYEMPIE
jgi:hypothetical protein